ncbi:hypothetical protein ACK6TD_19530 [Enterobacter hormaechei]|uniref:hypothetical protein n=1 Tax=Enterobacter hormaechei TaxID=158836 RepID=UPI003C2EBC65
MMKEKNEVNEKTTLTQQCMPFKTQSRLKSIIYLISFFMLIFIIAAEKYNIPHRHILSSITITSSVASIYLLTIYFQYGTKPERQKRLKAYIDAFANALALVAIVVTYISFIVYGKVSALYTTLASSKSPDVIFGVIIGVLFSRVLFPFWDLYSRYKKI